MNLIEKIVLSLGLLLWVVGDLTTTAIGLSLGLVELNPITNNLFQITLIKTGVTGAILIFIDFAGRKNLNILKVPIYTALVTVGSWAVVNNTMAIIRVI